MTITEGLNKIKALFEAMPAPVEPIAPVKAAATDYILADGTVVTIDKVEVGGVVTVGGVPAADAEHELADGTCVVTVGGVITEVKEKLEEAKPTDQLPAMMAKVEEFKKAQVENFNGVVAQLAAQKEIITQLFALVQELGKEPAAAPTEIKKSWEQMTALEKRRANK